ncbi:MAG: hypothetical protein IPG02_02855 [Ignavibacteria bacterium]|nr:hypothetical protein [Ignavibacteria bacterium]
MLERIPDRIIKIIPDIIFNPELPFPIPDPEPDPGPFPGPFPGPDPRPNFSGSFRSKSILESPERRSSIGMEKSSLSGEAMASVKTIMAKEEITSMLMTKDIGAIKNVISNYFDIFHPIFAISPGYGLTYRCDELKVVYKITTATLKPTSTTTSSAIIRIFTSGLKLW